jgi:hypothetical protein
VKGIRRKENRRGKSAPVKATGIKAVEIHVTIEQEETL